MLNIIATALIKGALSNKAVQEDLQNMADTVSDKVESFTDKLLSNCYVRPNIPTLKLNAAVNTYARELDPDEVIVLMDFGGFSSERREGLIITEEALYTGKDLPKKVSLCDIESIQLYRDHLYINGQDFCGITRVTPFHEKMIDIYISNVNPKSRDISITTADGLLGFLQNNKTNHIEACSRIYIKPLIPELLLKGQALNYGIDAKDIILIAQEGAPMFSKNRGFILTEDSLYASVTLWDSKIKHTQFLLSDISDIKLSLMNDLVVNGNKIYTFIEKDEARDFKNLLRGYLDGI